MSLEERLKLFIGQTVFSNLALTEQLLEAQRRIEQLEKAATPSTVPKPAKGKAHGAPIRSAGKQ